MKTFVRLITLLLAILMLAMTVIACDSGSGDGDGDGDGAQQEQDKYGREQDDLPTLNYQGDTIKVLNWNAQQPEFDIESVSSDNVRNALFDRNGEVERRLNVDLTFREELGDSATWSSFIQKVEQAKRSNTKEFDIIACYSRSAGVLAVRSCLEDLKDVEGSFIGWDKPYWPDNMINTVVINDSCYFISGDISPNLLYMMQVMYFNKDMLDQYWEDAAKNGTSIANGTKYEAEKDENGKLVVSPASRMIYDWAYKGTWTLDKLIALSNGADGTGIYKDNNKNGIRDSKDTYGFSSRAFQMDCFYTGSNLRLLEQTTDGSILKISEDYGSFKTVKLVSKLGNWFARNNSCYATVADADYYSPFSDGRTMFFAVRAEAPVVFGDKGAPYEYGIMPVPKYDEKQANYYTCMGNPFTLYCIFNGLPATGTPSRTDRNATLVEMTAVLECWASETYRLVTPEVFEVNMQLKYADTQYETDMFEIIRSSIVYDLGRIFAIELDLMSEKPSIAACKNASWATTYNSFKKRLDSKLEDLVSSLF